MNTYQLTAHDRVQDFEAGLARLGSYDFVSEHRNANKLVLVLGQSRAWTTIVDRLLPLVVDWKARITIPQLLQDSAQAEAILRIVRHRLSSLDGRWLVDIRSEARTEGYADLARLVRQDIDRGDLPNRLVFERGLKPALEPQIRRLRQQLAADPNFDWRRVRVDVGV